MNQPRFHIALWIILAAALPALMAQPDRIATRIDGSQPVVLTGRVPRQATAEHDTGPVDPSFPMPAVVLTFRTSAAQQADLEQLLLAQQDSTSPRFRRWLTPEQYADRFGVSVRDLAKIKEWLESQGLTLGYVARARNFIAFGGTAQQIADAFHTEIHGYIVNGETHYASATAPSIPAALAGLVSGIRGLDDFRLKPQYRTARPQMTVPPFRGNALGPLDFATIYDVKRLYSAGINGTGQSIAIVGQSDILTSDIASFRSQFGLGAPNLQLVLVPGTLGGGDPGHQPGDETESDLDVEWSGAVAPNATIDFVYAKSGVAAAERYVVDQALAPVMSISYGGCEQIQLSSLGSDRDLMQQASAEGITVLAASGDMAAAGCDEINGDPAVAEAGLAVIVPESIPEITSVGGTELNEGHVNYWVNGAATGYIPETVWNDTEVFEAMAGGGGGASAYYTQPPWQNGIAPNDGMRHVPDVSLAASNLHDPYFIYTSDYASGGWSGPGILVGGTSCSSPSMAGIVALLNQYLVSSGAAAQGGLGNINPTLYRLAQTQSNAFHDIVNGDNIVPCADSPDCINGFMGWAAGPGYDSASGLGSVDAYNLVHAWHTALATQPLVVPSLDSNPEFETEPGSNQWVFAVTLSEQAGFATTLTGVSINGVNLTAAQIQSLFNTAAIPAGGSITGTYDLQNLNVSSGPVNVPFTFSGGTGSTTWNTTLTIPFSGPKPVLTVAGMSNAASGQQAFAPGAIISVYGTGLGSFAQAVSATPLPDYAAGFMAVAIAGNSAGEASLLYVSPNQVNLQLPYELVPGAAQLVLFGPWGDEVVNFRVSASAPGIFSFGDTSPTRSPIGSGGAHVGDEVAIYVTGAGQATPTMDDGYTPSFGDVPVPNLPVSITVGGVAVTQPFAYAAFPSWSVGVLQIDFTIPANVPTGPQPLVVTVGTAASLPANITILP